MAKIDFIVPCYGYAHVLPECVNSLLRQEVRDIRVLVINDASPDDTEVVAEAMARKDSRITVLHNRENMGLTGVLNQGIAWAEADYLMAISADDLLSPGAALRAAQVLDCNPDIGMVYGGYRKFDTETVQLFDRDEDACRSDCWTRYEGSKLIEILCTSGTNFIETPTVFVRTVLQKRVGGYRHELPHCCDLDMWLRLAAHGAVAHINAIQGYRREHRGAMNKTYLRERWPDFEQRKQAFDLLFEQHGSRISNASALHKHVCSLLAEEGYWAAVRLLLKGRWASARRMFRFALRTNPRLKYRPPLGAVPRLVVENLRRSLAIKTKQPTTASSVEHVKPFIC